MKTLIQMMHKALNFNKGGRMKRLLVLLAVLGLSATAAFGTNAWRYQNGPNKSPYLTSATIYDIAFVKDTIDGHPFGTTDSTPVGFAVGGVDGGQGTVLFTTNGGANWIRRQTRWGGAIRAILLQKSTDSLRAVICGDGGYIAKSACKNDTGAIRSWGTTWTRVAVPDSSVAYVAMDKSRLIRSVAGKDSSRAAVVVGWKPGGTVRILWTPNIFKKDGAVVWTTTTMASPFPVYGVALRDSAGQSAYIVGAGGTRVATKSYSLTSTVATGAVSPPMYSVLALNFIEGCSTHVVIGGGRGGFMRKNFLNDSAATFTSLSYDSSIIYDAGRKFSNSAYAGGYVLFTDSVRSLPIVSATGDSGLVLYANTSDSVNGAAPNVDSTTYSDTTIVHTGSTAGRAVNFYAGGVVHFWLSGADSVRGILRSSGDTLWLKPLDTNKRFGCKLATGFRIYGPVPAASKPHTLGGTGNGGRLFSNSAFTSVASGFNAQNIMRIAFNQAPLKMTDVDTTAYWIVGSGGLFAKTTNQGTSWSAIRTGRALGDLYSICVRDTDKIWVGGRYGVIMKYGRP